LPLATALRPQVRNFVYSSDFFLKIFRQRAPGKKSIFS